MSEENSKGGCPFLLLHPDGCQHCWEGTVQEEIIKRGCMGKGESLQAILNYSEKGGNMLEQKNSVSVIPKVFWVFARRINRFSTQPGKLGLSEKSFGFCCSAECLFSIALLGNQKAPSSSVECCITPESIHHAKWAELLITS